MAGFITREIVSHLIQKKQKRRITPLLLFENTDDRRSILFSTAIQRTLLAEQLDRLGNVLCDLLARVRVGAAEEFYDVIHRFAAITQLPDQRGSFITVDDDIFAGVHEDNFAVHLLDEEARAFFGVKGE
jgi:hypothetical protein